MCSQGLVVRVVRVTWVQHFESSNKGQSDRPFGWRASRRCFAWPAKGVANDHPRVANSSSEAVTRCTYACCGRRDGIGHVANPIQAFEEGR